jgi:hypothetical protein
VVWQNTYGGPGYDWANAVHRTADGGAVVVGLTDSWGAGDWDFWMFRLDEKGSILWQKTYGGQSDDWSQSVERTSDGGTIVAGGTKSLGVGMRDFWVIKTDAKGEVAGPCPPGMISDSSCGPVASSAVPVATAAAPAAPATGFGETGAAAVHSQAVVMDQCGQAAASMQQAAGRAPKER